jgi:hypothetical protein
METANAVAGIRLRCGRASSVYSGSYPGSARSLQETATAMSDPHGILP